MKKTVRIISIMMSLLMLFALCACGGGDDAEKTAENASIFSATELSEYVVLGKYKGITVNVSESEFDAEKKALISTDVLENGLETQNCYSEPLYTGNVQNGDIANIDYEGKKDGVPFEGGTSQGYDLRIGSHSFIDGFEEGLVGVKIGDTVDLNLTFPENYSSEELAGKAVVFTVKVNHVKTPDVNKTYSQLGFKSAEEYEADLSNRAKKALAISQVINNCKVTGISKKDENILFDAYCDLSETRLKANGTTLEEALKSYNMTLDDYRNQISSSLESEIKESMVYYSILKKEGLEIDYDLPESEVNGQSVLDEMAKVKHIVEDFVLSNSTFKITA